MKKNKILDLEKREFLVVISFCCMVMKLIELLEFSTNVHDIVLTKSKKTYTNIGKEDAMISHQEMICSGETKTNARKHWPPL